MKVEIKTIEQLRRFLNISTTKLWRVSRQTYINLLKWHKLTDYIAEELCKIFNIDRDKLEELIENELKNRKI